MITSSKSLLVTTLFWSALTAVMLMHVGINRRADFTFPVPWPDEAHFFWQAHGVAENNSLQSDAVNTDRTILWQPPAYFVITGLAFKYLGSSFVTARLLSLVWMLGAMTLMVVFCTHYGHRWLALAVCGLFFLSSRFIACGNVVRMESLLLLTVIAGFLLIQRRKAVWGLALLGAAPLIHFNGVLFWPSALILVGLTERFRGLVWKLRKAYWLPLVLTASVWLAYAAVILLNWDSFLHDMGFQFGRKGARDVWLYVQSGDNLLIVFVIIAGIAHGLRTRFRASELLIVAFPFWISWSLGHELWYEIITDVGFMLITLYGIHLVFHLLPVSGTGRRRAVRMITAGALLVLLVGWNYRSHRVDNPLALGSRAELTTMHIGSDVPYFTDADKRRVADILRELRPADTQIEVEFEPVGDGLFFQELTADSIRVRAPIFQRRLPALYVVHRSRHLPTWWPYGDRALERADITRDSTRFLLYERDSTEQWYFAIISDKLNTKDVLKE